LSSFETEIKRMLERRGWSVYHSGLPDFVCFKDDKTIFVEVKDTGDKLRGSQASVIKSLRASGFRVEVVWRNDERIKKFRDDLKNPPLKQPVFEPLGPPPAKCHFCGRRHKSIPHDKTVILGRFIVGPEPEARPIPVVKAEPEWGTGFLTFYCEYCKVEHLHGRGDGHRVAHCLGNRSSPFNGTGYFLNRPNEYFFVGGSV
jgi:hypothetical protein